MNHACANTIYEKGNQLVNFNKYRSIGTAIRSEGQFQFQIIGFSCLLQEQSVQLSRVERSSPTHRAFRRSYRPSIKRNLLLVISLVLGTRSLQYAWTSSSLSTMNQRS